MKKYPASVQFSLYTAIVSFATAAVIFALYFFSGDLSYAFLGYFCMLIFGFVNIIALAVVAVAMKTGAAERRHGWFAIMAQLANIPVALFCLWAGANLSSIARITFVNETGSELQNVKIIGCEDGVIEHLAPGESETKWIHITHDCNVRLEYQQNDSTASCSVSGYLSTGMGRVQTYNIGGANDPWFE